MRTVIVRYKVKPGAGDENQRLIEAVFAQLSREAPPGLSYESLRAADGVSFTHVASITDPERNPLTALDAFKAFTKDIKDRCEEPPVTVEHTRVGLFRP